MSNVTRFDPFNDLVDGLFKGFLVRPMYNEARAELPLPKKAAAARKQIAIN